MAWMRRCSPGAGPWPGAVAEPGRARREGRRLADGSFSLVELLVVIAIIAVLLAITLPAVRGSRRCASRAVCMADLREIGLAMADHADDFQGLYPRALPLAPGADPAQGSDWEQPWPADVCPMYWQACYPSRLALYLGVPIVEPFDLAGLPAQLAEDQIQSFRCPDNTVPRSDADQRKCGFPLDYGLANRASQNGRDELDCGGFLAADMTWGLAYVPGRLGPGAAWGLARWWVPFPHRGDTANVVGVDLAVQSQSRPVFLEQHGGDLPIDDPL
jgi:prepilin-type N-terminal cleavage/methylation domain-containing protein